MRFKRYLAIFLLLVMTLFVSHDSVTSVLAKDDVDSVEDSVCFDLSVFEEEGTEDVAFDNSDIMSIAYEGSEDLIEVFDLFSGFADYTQYSFASKSADEIYTIYQSYMRYGRDLHYIWPEEIPHSDEEWALYDAGIAVFESYWNIPNDLRNRYNEIYSEYYYTIQYFLTGTLYPGHNIYPDKELLKNVLSNWLRSFENIPLNLKDPRVSFLNGYVQLGGSADYFRDVILRLDSGDYESLPDIVCRNVTDGGDVQIVSYSVGSTLSQKVMTVFPSGDGEFVLNFAVSFGLTPDPSSVKILSNGKSLVYGTDYMCTVIPAKKAYDKTIIAVKFLKNLGEGSEIIGLYNEEVNSASWYGSIVDGNRSTAYWDRYVDGVREDSNDVIYLQNEKRMEDKYINGSSHCYVFGIKIYKYSNYDKMIHGFNGGTDDWGQSEGYIPDAGMYDPETMEPLYLLSGAEFTITGDGLDKVIVLRDNLVAHDLSGGEPLSSYAVSEISSKASTSPGGHLVEAMGRDVLLKLLYYRYEQGIKPLEDVEVDQTDPYYALKTVDAYTQAVPAAGNTAAYANDGKVYTLEPEGYSAKAGDILPVGDGGGLLIGGLGIGTYTLTETKAPDGYVTCEGPMTVELYWADDSGNKIEGCDPNTYDGNLHVHCKITKSNGEDVAVGSAYFWDASVGSGGLGSVVPPYDPLMNPMCSVLVYPIGNDRMSLEITKDVFGNGFGSGKNFNFLLTLRDPETNEVLTDVSWGIFDKSSGQYKASDTVISKAENYPFVLADGDRIVFTNIPDGTKYEVSESSVQDDWFVRASGVLPGETTSDGSVVTRSNGKVTVSGVLNYENSTYSTTAFENMKQQEVHILKTDPAGRPISGAEFSLKGDMLDPSLTWVSGTVASGYVVKLNPGTYTLSETKVPTGFVKAADIVFTVTDDGNVQIGGKNITKDTNGYIFIRMEDAPEVHSISLMKTITGNMADMNKRFDFILTLKGTFSPDGSTSFAPPAFLSYKLKNGTSGSLTGKSANGSLSYSFTLGHDEMITFLDIPYGVQYEITEDADGYVSNITNGKGKVEKRDISVTAVNTREASIYSLSVNKQVSGNMGDKDRGFSFIIELSNEDFDISDFLVYERDSKRESFELTNGAYTFALKHGETITFPELPEGTEFSIREVDDRGYSTSIQVTTDSTKNQSGKNISGVVESNTSVVYTNSINVVIPIGTALKQYSMIFIVGLVSVSMFLFLKRRQSRKEKEE